MIDYVMAGVDGFRDAEIQEMLHRAAYNYGQYGYTRLLLCFISESTHFLAGIPNPMQVSGVTVEYVPLLLNLKNEPNLSEIGRGGRTIAFYDSGNALDVSAGSVERDRKRSAQ